MLDASSDILTSGGVGVSVTSAYEIKRIDSDFFDDSAVSFDRVPRLWQDLEQAGGDARV